MTFDSPAYATDASAIDAELFRRAIGTLLSPAGGIVTPGDLQVTQQTVPNMSVQIGTGAAWIPGTSTATQGPYYSRNGATVTQAINASDASKPRIDIVGVQVIDKAYAGASASCAPFYVAGTPTTSATLVNRLGVGSAPASSLILAYVLVPANATSIVTADLSNVASLLSVAGSRVLSAASGTLTLPAPSPGALVNIQAASSVSGASPATITYGAGGGKIFGAGLSSSGVTSFPLGTPFASATLEGDATGANWLIVAGQQDTGWVALTLLSGFGGTGGYVPAVRILRDVGYLSGEIKNNTGGTVTGVQVASLPAAFAPASQLLFSAGVIANLGTVAVLTITGTALTLASSMGSAGWVGLDGMSYRLS